MDFCWGPGPNIPLDSTARKILWSRIPFSDSGFFLGWCTPISRNKSQGSIFKIDFWWWWLWWWWWWWCKCCRWCCRCRKHEATLLFMNPQRLVPTTALALSNPFLLRHSARRKPCAWCASCKPKLLQWRCRIRGAENLLWKCWVRGLRVFAQRMQNEVAF